MSNSRQTDFEPPIDSLLEQLRLKGPSVELDQKISALARKPKHGVAGGQDGLRISWPAIVSVAVVAGLFGFVLGNQLDLRPDKIQIDSAALVSDIDATSIQGSRTLVSAEIENGIEAFHWIHGHSMEPANQDCTACHVFSEPTQIGVFYDRDILAQHPDYFPKCSRCHTDSFTDPFTSESNS